MTDTEAVTLTDDEREQLRGTWTRYDGQMGAIAPDVVFAAVESIVAARLAGAGEEAK